MSLCLSDASIPVVTQMLSGLACVIDEAAPVLLSCLDQSLNGIGVPWQQISVTGAPLGRIAQRFLVWGS